MCMFCFAPTAVVFALCCAPHTRTRARAHTNAQPNTWHGDDDGLPPLRGWSERNTYAGARASVRMARHYVPPGSGGGAEGAVQSGERSYGTPPVDLAESVAAVSGATAGTSDRADVEMAEAKDDDAAVDLTGDDDDAVVAASYT